MTRIEPADPAAFRPAADDVARPEAAESAHPRRAGKPARGKANAGAHSGKGRGASQRPAPADAARPERAESAHPRRAGKPARGKANAGAHSGKGRGASQRPAPADAARPETAESARSHRPGKPARGRANAGTRPAMISAGTPSAAAPRQTPAGPKPAQAPQSPAAASSARPEAAESAHPRRTGKPAQGKTNAAAHGGKGRGASQRPAPAPRSPAAASSARPAQKPAAAQAAAPGPADLWICPLCGAPLAEGPGGALVCPARHSFDRAREGYWHLLPVQAMRTRAPGDSREMVAARRTFLEGGYYAPFGAALARLVLANGRPAADGAPLHVLDAGCGEGWYDRAVAAAADAAGRPLALAGFDIAKPAVRLAARALPGARYAVASSFHAPVRTGWADVVLNIFSPFARESFARVLRPGGLLLYAVPTARHLFGLKQALYETPYENPVQQIAYPGFTAIGEETVTDTITVPGPQLQALFAMTPYYWRTPADGAARLQALDALRTEIGFRFLLFTRDP